MAMRTKPYAVLASALLAAALWFWVQHIAIPHQQIDSAAHGIPRGNLSDLYPRWLGARELLLHHRDPYSADITCEIQSGYYGRPLDPARPNDPKDQQAFAYPAYVVFLLAPTVTLPFAMVQKIFLLTLLGLTAASVFLWLEALGWRISWNARLVWIILTLGSFPAIQGFKLQQLTLLVAALLAAAMACVARRQLALAGILLALASIKPQLVALMVAWLCLWAIGNWRERRALIFSYTASMIVLVGAAEIFLPGWIGEFRVASAAYYQYTGGGRSVLDVMLSPLIGRPAAALLIIALLIILWRGRHAGIDSADFHLQLALVMAITLAIIPMFAPYNQLLLLPALMTIVREGDRLWSQSPLSKFFVALVAVAVAWPWIASALLTVASVFLPAARVQQGWALPLYSSLWTPITVLATLWMFELSNSKTRTNSSTLRPHQATE